MNNAGFGQAGAIEEVPVDRLQARFDIKVFGPLRLMQTVLPHMRNAGSGAVVNISRLMGRVTYPTRGAYAGSKHALQALSDTLRAEVSGSTSTWCWSNPELYGRGSRIDCARPNQYSTSVRHTRDYVGS